jgi:hypothetical protein
LNLEYKHLLNNTFSPQSKVWVYQAGRLLSLAEALEAEDLLNDFIANWKSHGKKVNAEGYLFFGQFLIILADESDSHIGGCGTDNSVRFVKKVGEQLNIDFFDRTTLAFVVKDKIQMLPYTQLPYAFENGFLNPDDLYFNNLVATKQELEGNWLIPINQSWIGKKLKLATEV